MDVAGAEDLDVGDAEGRKERSTEFKDTVALAVAGAAVVLGVTAAIIPAHRAARLKVITALTYE